MTVVAETGQAEQFQLQRHHLQPVDFVGFPIDDLPQVSLNGGVFLKTDPSEYGVYNRDQYLPQMERVCATLASIATHEEIEQTLGFAERAFDLYEGKEQLEHEGSHVFVIPTFISRDQQGRTYNTQIESSFPIAKYLDPKTLVNAVKGVPPCIVDSYPVDADGRQAHVLFAPILPDMMQDLEYPRSLHTARQIINDTVRFAHDRIGANIAGLGAILPLIVQLGKEVNVEGMTTTTGHGGTVHLVAETIDRVVAEKGLPGNAIGIVGAKGSIGRASLAVLLERYPNAKFVVNDTAIADAAGIKRFLGAFDGADQARIQIVPTLQEVFDQAKVAVSAITGTIDVAKETTNLEGVVIVDDSQPGAFDPIAVEAKGGNVVWVVGQDNSAEGKLTRQGSFRFGDTGLMRMKDVFGCEAEASSVYNFDPSSAISTRVTPAIAKRIGQLFKENEIGVADTLQTFGRAVLL